MPYRHEIIYDQGNLFVSHSRASLLPSGLFVAEEIARTNPRVLSSGRDAGRLVIARAITPKGQPDLVSGDILDAVECDGLSDFKNRGVELWRKLLTRLGQVGTVRLTLAEELQVTDIESPGGLVLPIPPSVEFKGYYANPQEIETLEEMVRQITIDIARVGLSSNDRGYL